MFESLHDMTAIPASTTIRTNMTQLKLDKTQVLKAGIAISYKYDAVLGEVLNWLDDNVRQPIQVTIRGPYDNIYLPDSAHNLSFIKQHNLTILNDD